MTDVSFPKYDRYKNSGVEWLGEVPEHWKVEKGLRNLFETEDRSVTGDEELLSIFLNGLPIATMELKKNALDESIMRILALHEKSKPA